MILDLKLDADGGNSSLKSNSINVLNKIISVNDLLDIRRVRHRKEPRFAWRKMSIFAKETLLFLSFQYFTGKYSQD